MTPAKEPAPSYRTAGRIIDEVIPTLQYGYRNDHAGAVAQAAQLRNAAGRTAAAVPGIWGSDLLDKVYTTTANHTLSEPEALDLEFAVLTAATVWACHQQSIRDEPMHCPDRRQLGAAVRRLMPDGTDTPARKRLVRAGEATTRTELTDRLTDVVAVLRRGRIHLDYATLADQIRQWTQPGGPDRVRAAWGRSFALRLPEPEGTKDEDKESPS